MRKLFVQHENFMRIAPERFDALPAKNFHFLQFCVNISTRKTV